MGLVVPLPETFPVAAENVLPGHVLPIELIAPQDVEAVLAAGELAMRCGKSAVTAHSATDPTREITVYVVDARARFGVLLGAVTGLASGAPAVPPRKAMGPRVAHLRQDEFAVVLALDPAFTRLLGWTEAELVGQRSSRSCTPTTVAEPSPTG